MTSVYLPTQLLKIESSHIQRYSTVELRKDIEEMEKEKEIVAKRIERMQRKARFKSKKG